MGIAENLACAALLHGVALTPTDVTNLGARALRLVRVVVKREDRI